VAGRDGWRRVPHDAAGICLTSALAVAGGIEMNEAGNGHRVSGVWKS